MQIASIFSHMSVVEVELPEADDELLPGIYWGPVSGFPSPAYWAYSVQARRLAKYGPKHKLSNSLEEEIGACLLGANEASSKVAIAAFKHLKKQGVFKFPTPTEAAIYHLLSMQLESEGGAVRFRYARPKARCLAAVLFRLTTDIPPLTSGRELRDWLVVSPGIGYRTASCIVRNWLDADDVAVLDIHVQRAGHLAGFFPHNLTVERNYLELERRFIDFSKAIDIRTSELDVLISSEMLAAPRTVNALLADRGAAMPSRRSNRVYSPDRSHSNTHKTLAIC